MIPIDPVGVVLLVLVAALALASAMHYRGLWIGERGRNADLRDLVKLRVGPPPPATVIPLPDPETEAQQLIEAEGREKLIADIMADAHCSRARAEAAADDMIGAVKHFGSEALP